MLADVLGTYGAELLGRVVGEGVLAEALSLPDPAVDRVLALQGVAKMLETDPRHTTPSTWLEEMDPSLGTTPADAIRAGRIGAVLEALSAALDDEEESER